MKFVSAAGEILSASFSLLFPRPVLFGRAEFGLCEANFSKQPHEGMIERRRKK